MSETGAAAVPKASDAVGVREVPPPPDGGASVLTLADQVRKWGMYLLLWAFLGTAGLSLATVFIEPPDPVKLLQVADEQDRALAVTLAEKPFDHLKQILQILLPVETALLGSAMGFYYGSQMRGGG
ncbi:MAG TPA: hypothetical protein VGX68_00505 [Thermoanaerobaculia bacterium]|jgi:hypothetical protein|nr:hypothetical protein [Thermoanaerobaculia bacterium]